MPRPPAPECLSIGLAPATRPLLWDVRGAVLAEYVVLLTVVAVGAALSVIACGAPLLELYRAQVAWLGLPIP